MHPFMLLLAVWVMQLLPTVLLGQSVMLINPTRLDRKGEVVSISWEMLLHKYPLLNPHQLRVTEALNGNVLPIQIEYNGADRPLNLLVQVDLAAKQRKRLLISAGASEPVSSKTYGRFVPERKDDFAWENDRIAFRMYGKALEKTPKEMAYGIDVWVKRTDRLVINERYKRGNYHEDQGDGMDYYHVGRTLGAGNCAPLWGDGICYDGTYARWRVLDNGPLRTTFQLEYDAWLVGPDSVTVTKIISLDAGSDFNRIAVVYRSPTRYSFPVAAGIVKRKEPGGIFRNSEKEGWMGYWEPEHGKDGITGVGVFVGGKASAFQERTDQYLLVLPTASGHSFTYYAGACWDRAGVYTEAQHWFHRIEEAKFNAKHPIRTIIE